MIINNEITAGLSHNNLLISEDALDNIDRDDITVRESEENKNNDVKKRKIIRKRKDELSKKLTFNVGFYCICF